MKLSEFEIEVMDIVWELGEAVIADVHAVLEKRRKLAYSTVKTIFSRLEDKGALERVRNYGRTVLYRPTLRRDEVARPLVKDFMNRLFGGGFRQMVSHALADEKLSAEDIAYLEALIAAKKDEIGEES